VTGVVGSSGETVLQCELSRCFADNSSQLYIRPRCQSALRLQISHLIIGALATRRCPAVYNSCCIDQTKDTWYSYRPQEPLLVNMTERCDGRRHCTLQVHRATVNSRSQQLRSDYAIVVFYCIANDTSTSPTPALPAEAAAAAAAPAAVVAQFRQLLLLLTLLTVSSCHLRNRR